MRQNKRDFKGIWIPKEVWESTELSLHEKLFYIEINSLDVDNQGCSASNAYFADFFKVSKARCSQIITSLEEKGYVLTQLIMDGNRVEKRLIFSAEGGSKFSKGGSKFSKGRLLSTFSRNKLNNITASYARERAERQDGSSENEKKTLFENGKITPKLFESFWRLYPNKKCSKGSALVSWQKLCTEKIKQEYRPTWEIIRTAIRKQKQTERWKNPKFIPLATTWLNQYRWLDDPAAMCELKVKRQRAGFTGKNTIDYKEAEKV